LGGGIAAGSIQFLKEGKPKPQCPMHAIYMKKLQPETPVKQGRWKYLAVMEANASYTVVWHCN